MSSHSDREQLIIHEYTEFILEDDGNHQNSVDSKKTKSRTAAEILQHNLSASSLSTTQVFWKNVLYHKRTTLIGIFILLVIILVTGVDIIKHTSSLKETVCKSDICLEIAADIKASMNASYDPCWNFYKYACGGWIDKHPPPENNTKPLNFFGWMDKQNAKVIRNIFEKGNPLATSKAEQMARDFYVSCMNQHLDESSHDTLYDDYHDDLPDELLSNETVFPNVISFSKSRSNYFKNKSSTHLSMLHNVWQLTESTTFEYHKSMNCTEQTIDNFPDVTARLFVLDKLHPQKQNASTKIYNIIKDNYIKIITNATWIHPDSKSIIIEQLTNLIFVNGYPETIMDFKSIDWRYENITISNITYSKNIQSLKNDYIKRLFITYFNFERYVILANAFYYIKKGEIFILAGIQQKPVFDPEYPEIINYARLGFAISHEMSHAFQYYYYNCTSDEECSYEPNDPRKCIEDFYNHINTNKNISVDGIATVEENFSDVAGLKVALSAYNDMYSKDYQKLPGLESYTQHQLFFIVSTQLQCTSMGSKANEDESFEEQVENDSHSPNSVRVLGALSNTKEFAEAFKCPVGNQYNPAEKCPVF